MDIAADSVRAGFVEPVSQGRAQLLQAKVGRFVIAGPKNIDVVYDVVLVGKDDAVAPRKRCRTLREDQTVLTDRDGGRGLGGSDDSRQESDGGGEANGHDDSSAS